MNSPTKRGSKYFHLHHTFSDGIAGGRDGRFYDHGFSVVPGKQADRRSCSPGLVVLADSLGTPSTRGIQLYAIVKYLCLPNHSWQWPVLRSYTATLRATLTILSINWGQSTGIYKWPFYPEWTLLLKQ